VDKQILFGISIIPTAEDVKFWPVELNCQS